MKVQTRRGGGLVRGRGGYSSRARPRGRIAPQVHRNRTLVLNGTTPATLLENTVEKEAAKTSSTTTPAWVTKTDRHLQLINPAIFEKQSLERSKAIEETRKLKLKQRDERERLKLGKHLQRLQSHVYMDPAFNRPTVQNSNHEINVEGIQFRVLKGGSKLVKAAGEIVNDGHIRYGTLRLFMNNSHDIGDANAAKATPKTTLVGGVRFYRSKHGNLYRSGVVKAQRYGIPWLRKRTSRNIYSTDCICDRRQGHVKKIDEQCRIFSTTGRSILSSRALS